MKDGGPMWEEIYKAAKCTPVEIAVLQLTAASLGGSEIKKEEFAGVDWYAVYEEMKLQGVAALPMDILHELEEYIPNELMDEWVIYAVQVMNYGEKILNAQQELIELLDKNKIHTAILKGAAAAVNYPNPMYRNMGDIDFLISRKDFMRAYKLLKNSGFKCESNIDDGNTIEDIVQRFDHHISFVKGNICYEMHYRPAGIFDEGKSVALDKVFEEAVYHTEISELNGYSYNRLPSPENGVVLILHIVHHLTGGLGLRQICDWMMYISNEITEDTWVNELMPLFRETGLERLACTLTEMCRVCFGIKGIAWCTDVDKKLCTEFLRFVFDNGNFGRKGEVTNRLGTVFGEVGSERHSSRLVNLMLNLHRQGVSSWKAVQKVPALKCVAWAYLPVRYICKLFKGERTIGHTFELVEGIKSNRSLRDKLAVFK